MQVCWKSTAVIHDAGISLNQKLDVRKKKQSQRVTSENKKQDWIPVAVACCSLCEAGTTATCKKLDPHSQLCLGH